MGWDIVAADAPAGRIEATATTDLVFDWERTRVRIPVMLAAI
jgi:hypothetical protein